MKFYDQAKQEAEGPMRAWEFVYLTIIREEARTVCKFIEEDDMTSRLFIQTMTTQKNL